MAKIRDRDEARERAAALRAALIASEIHNANRINYKGQRICYTDAVEAADYLSGPKPVQYVDGKELQSIVRGWLGKGALKQ